MVKNLLLLTTWGALTNKINLHIETPTRKFNVNTDYKVKGGHYMIKFHGENPLTGKFEIMRDLNMKADVNQIDAKCTGKAVFAKGPLAMFSPIDTVSTLNYNIAKMVLNADIAKTIAGQKWGLKVSQNKVNLYTGQPWTKNVKFLEEILKNLKKNLFIFCE